MQLPFGAFLAVLRGETTLGRLMLEEDSPLHVEGKLGLLGRTQEILVPPGTF